MRIRFIWSDASRLPVAAALLAVFVCQTMAVSAQGPQRTGLTVAIPGIRDAATDAWTQGVASVSPTKHRYVIRPETPQRRGFWGWLLEGGNAATETRANTTVIEIDDPYSEEGLRKIREIAKLESVSVVVDMDIGLELGVGSEVWSDRTNWGGTMAAVLANEHLAEHPESPTRLIGHSAGTQAMAFALGHEDFAEQELFTNSFAASPMDDLPTKTTVILADYDLPAVRQGDVTQGRRWDAETLRERGHTVLRVVTESRGWAPVTEFSAHAATADLTYPDQRVVVYSPGGADPVEIPSTSLSTVINHLAETEALSGEQLSVEDVEELALEIRVEQPTEGLGGVSLNATARVPIDPESVVRAVYDGSSDRIILNMRDGDRLRFPMMDPEVLRLAYQSVFLSSERPELSIGAPPEGRARTRRMPPGTRPVYYLGGTEGTLLGLALYRADVALGTLAWGMPAEVREVSERVAEFHTLAELYAARYADHPTRGRYTGTSQRIFTHPASIEFAVDETRGTLDVVETRFAARFGDLGPAEAHFVAVFAAYFDDIVETEVASPIRALIPHAQAIGMFRWMRESGVLVAPGTLLDVPLQTVFTPAYTASREQPRLEDVAMPRPPITLFGPLGPERIIRADGRESSITYRRDQAVRVTRYDGSVLEILRDDLGRPLGLVVDGAEAAAFYTDPDLGPVFAEDVILGPGGTLELRPSTMRYPDNEPEALIKQIIRGFLMEGESR